MSNSSWNSIVLDEKFIRASNVNVSNFVSVKLSGAGNYKIWRAQMVCLMETHQMVGIIDDEYVWLHGATDDKMTKQYQNLLKGWIFGSVDLQVLENVVNCRYPLEIWGKLYDLYAADVIEISIEDDAILKEVMQADDNNNKLETKLYQATMEGPWWKAKAILKTHKDLATKVINDNGDTMLHLAVRQGNNYFVKNFLDFIQNGKDIEKKNLDDQTALHIAAILDNKDAAQLLVKKRKELLAIKDKDSYIPLLNAYHENHPNTFVYLFEATNNEQDYLPSSFQLEVEFLTNAIGLKQYDLVLKLLKIDPLVDLATKDDRVMMALTTNFPSDLGFWEALIYPSLNGARKKIIKRSSLLLNSFDFLYKKAEDILWATRRFKNTYYLWLLPEIVLILLVPVAVFYVTYQLIRLLILVFFSPLFMLYPHLWKVLVFVVPRIKIIEMKTKDYKEAKEILKVICIELNKKKVSSDNHYLFYEKPILEAARVDACEVVVQILCCSKYAMNWTNERWHNIFQVAIVNRSQNVYNLLSPKIKCRDSYRTRKDTSGNSLVHLAGGLASSFVLSRTTGAALQLQRELQWHEEVKKLMFPTELIHKNLNMETSDMMFTREHMNLLKEGESWMKTTAESCSITAALIITIVFAAAITVPGGSNQETGIPLFKKEIAFIIFAVSDALSLFTAATALLVFLSILTTRFAEKDFLVSLPRRLIYGLCALIISTIAMMIAFGAVLFLVFCDQRIWMLVPIGLFACLPISVIVTLQLPLVLDLYLSTHVPIFGQKEKSH